MKIYIAGPMRGYPGLNFPAFDAARDKLRALGHEVVSPADMDRKDGHTDNRGYAKRDTEVILTCEAICLLNGWSVSIGGTAEFFLARWIGLKVFSFYAGKLIERSYETLLHEFLIDHYCPQLGD
jgi:hypothetical protein